MLTNKQTHLFANGLTRTGTLILAATAFVLPACGSPTTDADVPEVAEEPVVENPVSDEAENVTIEDLTASLDNYLGETVTVREEIEELAGGYAFVLESDQLFGGDEVVIINASGESLELVEGDDTEVQVTGEVRELIVADLEQEFNLDLDPEQLVDYEQQPVIIAQSMALAPDPNDISDNPEQYYYRRIALNGEVESILDTNIITIDDESLFGGEDVLVINPQAQIVPREGEEVTMTGMIRPFIEAEIEQDYDLTWDLDLQREIEAEYGSRPIFIADEIYPSAI